MVTMKKGFKRSDFPIFSTHSRLVYLDSGATAQKPQSVIDAEITYYKELCSPVHRGIYDLAERATERFEQVRTQVMEFINAESVDEIVFVRGTTEAINTVSYAFGLSQIQAGDEIVVTMLEHHANCVPWIECARKNGATLNWIPIDDQGGLILEDLEKIITNKTKLVALTIASNVIGSTIPFECIIARAKEVGAYVLLDGAQYIAHQKVDVRALGCDFFVFSGHKMLGPTGVGVLYANKRTHSLLQPFQTGGSMISSVTTSGATWREMPALLEAGTPAIAQVIGLGAAIEYYKNEVDYAGLAEHEHALCKQLVEGLLLLKKVHIVGDPNRIMQTGHLVSFSVDDMHPHDISAYLAEKNICIRAGRHCAQPLHDRLGLDATARASLCGYNTVEDIEALLAGLRELVS